MLLSEIFDQLTHGELRHVALGGDQAIGMQECDYPGVIPHVNLALSALYTRFDLKREQLTLQQQDAVFDYLIDSQHAVSNTASVEKKWIIDTEADPYQNTLIHIEKVLDADENEIVLNNKLDEDSFFTPDPLTLRIPAPVQDTLITIKYRAKLPEISSIGLTPQTVNVLLPYPLLTPLLFFVASRVYANMNTDQNQESQVYMQKYEMACQQISDQGIPLEEEIDNVRLDANGWA